MLHRTGAFLHLKFNPSTQGVTASTDHDHHTMSTSIAIGFIAALIFAVFFATEKKV